MRRLWLLLTLAFLPHVLHAQDGPQIYNMSFDTWSNSAGAWNLYPAAATDAQKVWDTANHGLSILGINGTVPEYRHLAVPGEGESGVTDRLARMDPRDVDRA